MRKKSLLLGFCPIGKFVFSHEDALRYKGILEEKFAEWHVNYVSIDDVIPDGMVRSQKDVEPVVDHFRKQGIDALFIPHCNFGTEGAAAVIARDLGVPVLLWGPRDESPKPDGTRLRDTLCGLFATSKVLHKLGVPFSYIENCRVDDDAFKSGLDTFLRAANVVKAMKHMRIGQVGSRIDFFWTTIVNESELLEKFGVEVLPIDMVEFIDSVRSIAKANRSALLDEIETVKSRVKFEGFSSEDQIINIFAARDALLKLAEDECLDVFAFQSFMSVCDALDVQVEYSTAMLAQAGIPVACETDIHGAVSSAMLAAASYHKDPIIFADLTVRHPDNDNGVLVWHAAFPESLKNPECAARVGTHWVQGAQPGTPHWELKRGPMTVFRFDGDRGVYSGISGEGKAVDGPKTQNTYVWMEVNDWPEWERRFIYGPYIHHVACCYGNYSAVMREACRFIPDLNFEELP